MTRKNWRKQRSVDKVNAPHDQKKSAQIIYEYSDEYPVEQYTENYLPPPPPLGFVVLTRYMMVNYLCHLAPLL